MYTPGSASSRYMNQQKPMTDEEAAFFEDGDDDPLPYEASSEYDLFADKDDDETDEFGEDLDKALEDHETEVYPVINQ